MLLERGGRLAAFALCHAAPLAEGTSRDEVRALKVAAGLVQDAGFEPVVVGSLARAKEFDAGTPVYGKALAASELRRGLGLNSQ